MSFEMNYSVDNSKDLSILPINAEGKSIPEINCNKVSALNIRYASIATTCLAIVSMAIMISASVLDSNGKYAGWIAVSGKPEFT